MLQNDYAMLFVESMKMHLPPLQKKGITVCKRKMESAKVEAMLNEAGGNWTNARILF
jgi:hypothetical protein